MITLRRLSSKPRGLLRDLTLILGLIFMRLDAELMVVGGGVFLVGLALHFWSKGCLVRTWTVTTWGPYRLVRHPFYLANFLIDEGICLISGNLWLAALYVVAFLLVYLPTIRKEERYLTTLHGDAYTSYARAVPALLPYRVQAILGPLRFSWANIKREKELSRVLRILAIPAYFIIVGVMVHNVSYTDAQRTVLLWTAMNLALLLNAGSVLVRSHERAARQYAAETTSGRQTPSNDGDREGKICSVSEQMRHSGYECLTRRAAGFRPRGLPRDEGELRRGSVRRFRNNSN